MLEQHTKHTKGWDKMKSIYGTGCIYCEKKMFVWTKNRCKAYSCNTCVSKDSAARDGYNEARELEMEHRYALFILKGWNMITKPFTSSKIVNKRY